MMKPVAYKPLFDASQLPAVGPLAEDLRFDMKMLVRNQLGLDVDLACDVAAFANTAGGVLLVGAHEHPRDSGVLHAYVPMNYAEAQEVARLLKLALRLCSPKPIAEARPLALHPRSSEYVVAINCDPYAAPPIGVAQAGQPGGEKWWVFPTRRGRDTHNLRPEELATLMEPRLRRMSLLLGRITKYAPSNFGRASFHSTHGIIQTFDIVAIDADASSMRLRNVQDSREVVVPLVLRPRGCDRFALAGGIGI